MKDCVLHKGWKGFFMVWQFQNYTFVKKNFDANSINMPFLVSVNEISISLLIMAILT